MSRCARVCVVTPLATTWTPRCEGGQAVSMRPPCLSPRGAQRGSTRSRPRRPAEGPPRPLLPKVPGTSPRGVHPRAGASTLLENLFQTEVGGGQTARGCTPYTEHAPPFTCARRAPSSATQATLDRGQVSGGTVRTGSPQPRASGRGARPSSAGVGSLPSLGAPSAAHESHRPKYTQSCLHRLSLQPRLTSLFEIAIHGIYL